MLYVRAYDSAEAGTARNFAASRRKRKGAQLVEFAIVAPVMFLFILATFEFGRSFMALELITEAARKGCRGYTDPSGNYWPGAILGTTFTQQKTNATNAAINYLNGVGISGEGVQVTPSQPDPNEITVTVSVPVKNISWVPNPLFTNGGGNNTLVGNFTLTLESGL
jgi:Flp pilus assembly protein TadG